MADSHSGLDLAKPSFGNADRYQVVSWAQISDALDRWIDAG